MKGAKERFLYRKIKVKKKVAGTNERPRLSVHRGHKHIYAQLIDDERGHTLVAVSTLSEELKGLKSKDTVTAAKSVGELIAKKAIEKGFKQVVFDRGGYIYTGRVKAIADAARAGGLEF